MLMKTQDIGYIFQKLQSQKKKIEKLIAVLQSLDSQPSNTHVYYAEDSQTAVSYTELEARRNRVSRLEKLHMDMALQKELQELEKLTAVLHSLDSQPSNRHIYYADDREESKEIQSHLKKRGKMPASGDVFDDDIRSQTAVSYTELEARRNRVSQLEKLYMDMSLQKELLKKGRKHKLREDELAFPTSKPVYKWRSERKR